MIAEATAALGSLKAASDIAKALMDARDAAKFNAQLSEMLELLVSARLKTLETVEAYEALSSRARDLEAQVKADEDWEAIAGRLLPTEISYGIFAYLDGDNDQPLARAEKFCSNCVTQKKLSLLQAQRDERRRNVLLCPACKTQVVLFEGIYVDEEEPPSKPRGGFVNLKRG